MFEKEALGLVLLSNTNTLKVPRVIGSGLLEGSAFIVLEYLEQAPAGKTYWRQLGAGLAELHKKTSSHFGLEHDNYIGSLIQQNKPTGTWHHFLIESRLNAQLNMAINNGLLDSSFVPDFEKFLSRISAILPEAQPSLLHGDLWNGNVMPSSSGAAVFDPAVYYGAREMDIAMTTLFGGFDEAFYVAYNDVNPLPEAYDELEEVYQLYPLMVHLNLFGRSYLEAVKRIVRRFI